MSAMRSTISGQVGKKPWLRLISITNPLIFPDPC